MMNRTPKQKRAIEAKGNVLVSAAAGSGKTSVMTERICRIVASGEADISDILVLTFTDMAAAEMKKRIYNQLYELSVSQASEALGIMAERVVQADISTVHSFCQRVIREKYHTLGLSPSFHVSSDKSSKRLLGRCLDELIEEKLSNSDPDVTHLFETYGKRNGKPLVEMILSVFDAMDVLPEPKIYYDRILNQYDDPAYQETIKTLLERPVRRRLAHARSVMMRLHQIADQYPAPAAAVILAGYLDELDIYEHLFDSEPFGTFVTRSVMTTNLKYTEFDEGMRELFKASREYLKGLLDGIKKMDALIDFDAQYKREITYVKRDAKMLLDLVFSLKDRYRQAKQRQNVLDFNDLEHFAYEILKHPENAADFRYAYIFIDEYQDTNPLQEAIIGLIKQPDNLFMVGDVKQSIYAFRHAEPEIFLGKQNVYREHTEGEPSDQGELIRMNDNFRSSPAVVNGINAIMGRLMTPDFGEIDYQNKEALVFSSALDGGCISVSVTDTDETILTAESGGGRLSAKEAEAYAAANQILSLIGQPFTDRASGKEKGLQFSDIVVLLRELSSSGAVYKRVFEACGIPVSCELSGGADIPEIEVFNNLLKIILNPTDDIALLSVMRFTHFGFTADDLALIRIFHLDKAVSFYDCVKEYAGAHTDALAQKINQFFETLTALRVQSKIRSKRDFLSHCYHALNFEEILCASPRRSVKAEMLKGYIAALVSETPESAGLARINAFIADLKRSGESLNYQTSVNSTDAVTIMTVHKSKGLEFPVVILSGLNKTFYKENRSSYVMDKTLGLGFKLNEPKRHYLKAGLIYQSILESKDDAALYEELRLLYVAITRAENRLYLSGARKSLKKSLMRWLVQDQDARYFAGSFLDFIMPVVLDRKTVLENLDNDSFSGQSLGGIPDVPVMLCAKQGAAVPAESGREQIFKVFTSQSAQAITPGYAYAYDSARGIPTKKSVSAVKQDGVPNEKPRKQIQFSTESGEVLSGAVRGTAFHTVMQHVDLSYPALSELKQLVQSLLDSNILTPEEAETLDLDMVMRVLQSGLIKRAAASNTVLREKTFSLAADADALGYPSDESIIIQGAIDLCFIEDNQFVLVDYKTDRVPMEAIDQRMAAYQRQIDIYANAVEQLTGIPVKEKNIYLVHHQKIITR